jgi:hypothetical protein
LCGTSPSGKGLEDAVERALEDARVTARDDRHCSSGESGV